MVTTLYQVLRYGFSPILVLVKILFGDRFDCFAWACDSVIGTLFRLLVTAA